MNRELANYIAAYVVEECERQSAMGDTIIHLIDEQMILDAVDAYEGGAR